MFPTVWIVLLAHVWAAASPARPIPFEIASNKPFIRVSVNGSAPQWFILDTGCSGPSVVARECADRLNLRRGAEDQVDVGAGSGVKAGVAAVQEPVRLEALGETLSVADPRVLTLAHVEPLEGRRIDGLVGSDFMRKHVIQIDYARRQITVHDPATYAPPAGATVVPLTVENDWPVVEATLTTRGGTAIPCRVIIDTGVRNVITLFRPFAEKHGLYDTANLRGAVIGGGVGGPSRGDVARLDALTLGPATFPEAIAVFSRDTGGLFAFDGPIHGIVGGDLLRRHTVTFDYANGRMVLEPYPSPPAFEHDMSGLFLRSEAPDFRAIQVMGVTPETPAARAGIHVDDEIVSIDGRKAPKLTLDGARELLRSPGVRRIEVRRSGKLMKVRLEARRLV